MPAFHEVRFPLAIGFGSSGGPERRTDIVLLASGHEERNTRWADSRRRYNAGTGVHSLADLHTLIAFFEERRGRLYGFRWRDRGDWKSCPPDETPAADDQAIGTGDGATAAFQLVKTYGERHRALSCARSRSRSRGRCASRSTASSRRRARTSSSTRRRGS